MIGKAGRGNMEGVVCCLGGGDPKSSEVAPETTRNEIKAQIKGNSLRRPTVAAGSLRLIAMFSVFLLTLLIGFVPTRAFLPVTPLTDCPNLLPNSNVHLEQVAGSWRLAYMFIDDSGDLDEDNTCAVVEIMQVNETQMELLFYADGKKDEQTIERFTKEFDLTVLSPGEWVLHTSFMHLEFVHVTVIGFSPSHLVLTFCIDPVDLEDTTQTETVSDYDTFINTVDRDSLDDIFKAQKYNKLFKDLDELDAEREKQRRMSSRFFRRKRHARSSKEFTGEEESRHEKVMKYLKRNKDRPKKHLWTTILTKDNNVSALRFVENASLLMKFGYNVTKGQLISFGRCSLARK